MATPCTEGPWKVITNISPEGRRTLEVVEAQDSDLTVCRLSGTTTQCKQDAHLISAAPDLLAACKAYLEAMEKYGHCDKTDRLMSLAVAKAETTQQ